MSHPFTNIIVLVHNNLPVTESFVKHLFKNTENFRLIFVDNGSTDGVKQFLEDGKKSGKWKLIRSEENLGVIGGRNLGAKIVTNSPDLAADYFVNLDNDQLVGEKWLTKLHSLMAAGNFDIVGCEAWRLAPPKTGGSVTMGGVNLSGRSYFPIRHCEQQFEQWTYIGCGGMIIKTEVAKTLMSENMPGNEPGCLFDFARFNPAYYEDPDLTFRAIKLHNYKLAWCHDCPITHLGHQTLWGKVGFDKNKQFVKSWGEFKKKWFPYNPPLQQTLIN